MGRDDKGEKAPSVIVHLFEVRLPGNSRLLMVSPLLKYTGRSHFFSAPLSPSSGWWNRTISLDDCRSRWMERHKQKTLKMKGLPSRPAHPTEIRLLRVRFCVRVSVSDFDMKQSKPKETTEATRTDLIGRSRHYSRSLALQTESSELTVRVP